MGITLDRLRRECEALDAELVVVDASNGRHDSIRVERPWLQWIDYAGPLGRRITLAQQRNVGVRAAQGDVIAFCDVGGDPCPGWLETLVRPILSGAAAATCGPIVGTSKMMPTLNALDDGEQAQIVVTANFALSRSAFERVGGFDEAYSYGEDVDIGWRLEDAGLGVVGVAGAKITMQWGDFHRQLRRAFVYGHGSARFTLRHPRRIGQQVVIWPDAVAYPLWILGLPFAAAASFKRWWVLPTWISLLAWTEIRGRKQPTGHPLGALRIKMYRAAGQMFGYKDELLDDLVPIAIAVASSSSNQGSREELLTRRAMLATAGVPTRAVAVSGATPTIVRVVRLAALRSRGVRVLWAPPSLAGHDDLAPRRAAEALGLCVLETPLEDDRVCNGYIGEGEDSESDRIRSMALVAGELWARDLHRHVLVVIASESDPAAADAVIQALRNFVAPPGWSVHVDAFGSRRFTREVRAASPEAWTYRAYRQDPLAAIGKGWHPSSGSATILGGDDESTGAVAILLGKLGAPSAAPWSMSSVAGDGSFSFFDSHDPDAIIEAVSKAIATAESTALTDRDLVTTYLDRGARLQREHLEALLAGVATPRPGANVPLRGA